MQKENSVPLETQNENSKEVILRAYPHGEGSAGFGEGQGILKPHD
jgi:hypothetical protein